MISSGINAADGKHYDSFLEEEGKISVAEKIVMESEDMLASILQFVPGSEKFSVSKAFLRAATTPLALTPLVEDQLFTNRARYRAFTCAYLNLKNEDINTRFACFNNQMLNHLRKLEFDYRFLPDENGLSTLLKKSTRLNKLSIIGTTAINHVKKPVLSDNLLSSSQWKSLKILNLHSGELTDRAADALSSESNLSTLQIAYTRISEMGFKFLSKNAPMFKELSYTHLRTYENNVFFISEVLLKCERLRVLHLGHIELSHEQAEIVARNNPHLTELKIESTNISDEEVKVLAQNCTQLSRIYFLHSDHLTNVSLAHIGTYCDDVKVVKIRRCDQITSAAINVLIDNAPSLLGINFKGQITNNQALRQHLAIVQKRFDTLSEDRQEAIISQLKTD